MQGSGANSIFIALEPSISCRQFFEIPAKTLFAQSSFRSLRPSFGYLHQSPMQ